MAVKNSVQDHREPRLVTAQDLADALSVSIGWVRRHTLMGLPHLKCGKATRYDRAEVVSFLRTRMETDKSYHIKRSGL